MNAANKCTTIIRPSKAPSAIAAEAFFKQLPSNALSPNEEELVRLLEQVTVLAQEWLPRHVSIQTWLQKRCADKDFTRLMCEDGNTEQKPSLQVYPPPASAREDQIFWDSLPQPPELTFWEMQLQKRLEYATGSARRGGTHRGNPKLITELAQRPNIAECTKMMNLPDTVTLEMWISKRMGSAFRVSHKGTDAYVEACAGEKRAQQSAEYLEKLIGTIPTSKEVMLKAAIVDFITKEWPSKDKERPPTTNDLGLCASVQRRRQEILPSYVSLKDWCAIRIPEIEFYQVLDEVGAPIAIFLSGCVDTQAAKAMSERYLETKEKAKDEQKWRWHSHPKKKRRYWQEDWDNWDKNKRW